MKEELLFRLNSNQFMLQLLTEAYIRNDSINWLNVFKHIKDFVAGNISKEEFFDYCDKIEIGFEICPGANLIGGQFDLNTRKIVIMFTDDILKRIVDFNDNDLKELAANFWVNFTHEDTHRQQQFAAKDFNIFKNYKNITSFDWTEDLGENLEYFNQQIEADAYGREIGARLEKIYKNSVSSVFFDINANRIKDEYCKKIINVYKDPRISDKANKSFFRALYDFLNKNEKRIIEMKSVPLESYIEVWR